MERELAPPPAPAHRLYVLAGELGGDGAELAAAARLERVFMIEGVAWRRRG